MEANAVTKAAKHLRNHAPREFHEFVVAMQEYCDQLAREVVLADTQNVMYLQGGARRAAKLTAWLYEIEQGEKEKPDEPRTRKDRP